MWMDTIQRQIADPLPKVASLLAGSFLLFSQGKPVDLLTSRAMCMHVYMRVHGCVCVYAGEWGVHVRGCLGVLFP